jgi:cephalosporin hydroxylase
MRYERSRAQFPLLLNEWNLLEVGVEVGVCQGFHAANILDLWPGQLICVDPWAKIEGYEEDYDHEANYREAHHRLSPYLDRVQMIRDTSLRAAALLHDESMDFVYLDANHSYEAVRDDLIAWWPKVKRGGMLAGDDYGIVDEQWVDFGHGKTRFGVKRAVDEWSKKVGRNISIDILADWHNSIPNQGEVQARGWYCIK